MASRFTVGDLDACIDAHKKMFGADPLLVSVKVSWHKANARGFDGKIHKLCCNKGFLYRGIPIIFTTSPYVDDFMLGY